MTKIYLQQLARRLMSQRIRYKPSRVGQFEIVAEPHKKGEELTIVGFREAFFNGLPTAKLKLQQDTCLYKLECDDDGTWMSDQPCELVQMWRELAVHARGRVLIGGLGLGVLARMVSRRKGVTGITIVERSPEVLELVKPYLNGTNTVEADIYDFAESVSNYDVALLDTWQGTGEWVWQSEVVPLRRALAPHVKNIYCWMEQVMVNQVAQMLSRVADMDVDALQRRSTCHYYAFRRAVIDTKLRPAKAEIQTSGDIDFAKITEVERRNNSNPQLRELAWLFLWQVGTPQWESIFGHYWDEAWSKESGKGV